ncbi:pirin family protein [Thalassomonas viridans]|uniref:Pirin family protein n=1 Tax=Thalassomonas viridans TaxID=137584 RepID=A0AAE9Z3G7_9GAMM|nr:pirin family protein [Thalassomonas viridans]WDE05868.1 pirin family protein [Thalassomonas viridans]
MNKVGVAGIISRSPGGPAYIRGRVFERLKPFALFDSGIIPEKELFIDWHPHSGVATVTFPYDADVSHEDSEGNRATVRSRGLQWMASGCGVWHKESYFARREHIGILQLWLLLPPEEETAPVRYFNLQPEQIPQVANVRVLLGEYRGVRAAARISHNVSYLHIVLKQGESFCWQLPEGQTRGFVFSLSGCLSIRDRLLDSEQLALLEEQDAAGVSELAITAKTDSEFVLALTEPWPYEVVSHYGQVHTSRRALARGLQRIAELGNELFQGGNTHSPVK